jgi:hypothetical protein
MNEALQAQLEAILKEAYGSVGEFARTEPPSPLYALIDRAAQTVPEDAPPEVIGRAGENFRRVLAENQAEAAARGTSPIYDEAALQDALRKLCPIFPFC